MGCGKKSLRGRVYKSKKWAERFGRDRSIRKVRGGYKLGKKKR